MSKLTPTIAKSQEWSETAAATVAPENQSKKMLQTISFKLGNFDDENRTFTAIGSTALVDRMGDSIDQSGWVLDNFIKNPIIPWAHDYYQPPVARATEIGVVDGVLQFTYQAPPEGMYEFADLIWNFYRNQFMFAFSVGFVPLEYEGNWEDGYNFTKCELLEISAVVVPANPQALALAYKMGKLDMHGAKLLQSKLTSSLKGLDTLIKGGEETAEADATEKTLTNEGEMAQDKDMAQVEKAGAQLSQANRDKLQAMHDGLRAAHKAMDDHLCAMQDLLESVAPNGNGDDEDGDVDSEVAKEVSDKVVENGDVEAAKEVQPEAEVADETKEEVVEDDKAEEVVEKSASVDDKSVNKSQDSTDEVSKEGEANAADVSDAGADLKDEEEVKEEEAETEEVEAETEEDLDPDNLTPEQAEKVVQAVSEALAADAE